MNAYYRGKKCQVGSLYNEGDIPQIDDVMIIKYDDIEE